MHHCLRGDGHPCLRPSGCKAQNIPLHHRVPSTVCKMEDIGTVPTQCSFFTSAAVFGYTMADTALWPGMLILVLVLKDSLRTFFKSLSWSLGVRSLSLSWSLGVRSLSLSWSLGVRSLSLSWSLWVRS